MIPGRALLAQFFFLDLGEARPQRATRSMSPTPCTRDNLAVTVSRPRLKAGSPLRDCVPKPSVSLVLA